MVLFMMGEIAEAMNTQLVPEFEGWDFDESHSNDHGSASSTSDTDTPGELLCNLCGRRRECIRYVVCGHRACASCTKKLWWSRINRPDRARDPWPTSIPCPFCRAEVTKVVDGRDDAVGGGYAAVSVPTATGTAGAPVVNGGTTGTVAGNSGAGVAASGGGQGMLIVDWMLMRSNDAAWRLRLETAERAAAANGGGDADNGERAWNDPDVGDLDWNEFFFE